MASFKPFGDNLAMPFVILSPNAIGTKNLNPSLLKAEERSGCVAGGISVTGKDGRPHVHPFAHYIHRHLVWVDSGQVAHYPWPFVEFVQHYNIRAFAFTPFRRHENSGESLDLALAAQFH